MLKLPQDSPCPTRGSPAQIIITTETRVVWVRFYRLSIDCFNRWSRLVIKEVLMCVLMRSCAYLLVDCSRCYYLSCMLCFYKRQALSRSREDLNRLSLSHTLYKYLSSEQYLNVVYKGDWFGHDGSA